MELEIFSVWKSKALDLEFNSSIFRIMRTVSDIIKEAGGAVAIAAASNGEVSADAAYKWQKIGIPDRHWPIVMPLAGATAEEMLAANIAVRNPTTPEAA